MPIYLSDLLKDPGILMRSVPSVRKSRALLAEEREGEYYEAIGRAIEEWPIVSGGVKRG
jgi:hypothetical protein